MIKILNKFFKEGDISKGTRILTIATSIRWVGWGVTETLIPIFIFSYLLIPGLGDGSLWWKLAMIISCGTIAGAIIPELVKVFTSVDSSFVQNIVQSSRQGGASLNILSGFTTGCFSAYWLWLELCRSRSDFSLII